MAYIERHFGYLGSTPAPGAQATEIVLGPRSAGAEWSGTWDDLADMVQRDASFGCGPAELAAISAPVEEIGLSRRTVEAIKAADRRYPEWHLLEHALARVDDVTQARFRACAPREL